MSYRKILKKIIMPSIICAIATTIIAYNFPIRGIGPITDEELPLCAISAFGTFLVGFGFEYFKNNL